MPTNAPPDKPEANIKLVSGPELWVLEFRKEPDFAQPADDHQVGFKLNLALTRFTEHVLGAELSMEVTDVPKLSAVVSFRSVLEITDPPTDSSLLDKLLLQVGGRVAPGLMYPFVREVVVSTLLKALMQPIVPPIVNFEHVFDLNELKVPPPPPKT